MRALIALMLLLPVFAFGQLAQPYEFMTLKWDDNTDTTFSVQATGGDTSQAFRCYPDMSVSLYVNTAEDSIAIEYYLIASNSFDAAAYYSNEVGDADSIGYGVATAAGQGEISDPSTLTVCQFCKLVVKGKSTHSTGTAVTAQAHLSRFKTF